LTEKNSISGFYNIKLGYYTADNLSVQNTVVTSILPTIGIITH